MSINIRGSLLVVTGTFLFKVITLEHTNSKVFFYYITKRYIARWTDGRDGRMNTETCESDRPQLSSLIAFLEGWRGKNVLMYYFPTVCVNHLVNNVPLASTLKETDGWSKTWKTCEAI